MKLNEDVLLEVIEILRTGLSEGKDISDLLRDLDLEQNPEGKLQLTQAYLARRVKDADVHV